MLKILSTYALMTLGFFALMALVLVTGHGLDQGASSTAQTSDGLSSFVAGLHSPLSQMLMQVVLIVVVARAVGQLFVRFHQPAVVGEMFAGIALGPSLLGMIAPRVNAFVFPPVSLPNLSLLSQIGIILFMFVVGMELDTRLLKQRAKTALLVSHTSIFVPFLLGSASSLLLFETYRGSQASFVPFALFMGISMSITAFPVLARILQERGLSGTPLGNMAITCAAVGDVTAWCVLAFIVAVSKSQTLAASFATVIVILAVVGATFGLIRPFLKAVEDRITDPANPGRGPVIAALMSVFLCAFATEAIGIHALFGAFLAGVAMPKDPVFRKFMQERLEYFSSIFLLPVFFAFTGLRTQIGLLSGTTDWLVCGGILLVAVLGKLGGTAVAARVSGTAWRESLALGTLMNTRGLMELIALNLGLDLGVLSPKIFAMLVLMALITTFATGPVVAWLGFGTRSTAREGVPA